MGDIKLGVMPAFKNGVITDPRWCHEFAEMVEAEGVESIWTVEHVVVAKDYEPRYSYSESGRMPGAPGSGTVIVPSARVPSILPPAGAPPKSVTPTGPFTPTAPQ